jgi:hypothetical protein
MLQTGGLALVLAAAVGCASGPAPYNPMAVRNNGGLVAHENPLFVPQGPDEDGYRLVFDKTFDILHEYFEIASADRFSGEIRLVPLVSAGYFDGPRFGWYNNYELLESTFQTVRRRGRALITPADNGGYYIEIEILKELEDLPQPVHASGVSTFILQSPTERQYDVVDATFGQRGWIPLGHDCALEAVILNRLKGCL